MAIFRVGFSRFKASGATTAVTQEHTVTADTSLLLVHITMPATVDVTVVPAWSGSNFTLIKQTTSSGSAGDMHTYSYGLVSPAIETGDITYTVDSTSSVVSASTSWSGTVSTSVANAVTYLNEAVNNTASTTSVIGSAGTSGRTLLIWGGFDGADGDPATVTVGFDKIDGGDVGAISYYMAQKIAGAPAAATITWAVSDENAAQLLELIPEADLATQADVVAAALAYNAAVASYKQRLQ